MINDIMKKYEDMTEEEFEKLPEEEQNKIMAEINENTEKMAEDMKNVLDNLSDEEKAKNLENYVDMEKEMERLAEQSEEEMIAEMMNPEAEEFSEEELEEARKFIDDPEGYMKLPEKKSIMGTIKAFIKNIF